MNDRESLKELKKRDLIDIIIRQEKDLEKDPIDRVCLDDLDIACRALGIKASRSSLDKVIDLVELLSKRGCETDVGDLYKLHKEWND